MRQYFGTDGVRGVANEELTPELAFQLGVAGGYILKRNKKKARFIIAKDTRLSGDMLEASLMAGLMAVGVDVYRVGVLPTPAVAYLVRTLQLDGGVMISASHNPFEDNGIKFFGGDGYKLSDETELAIEKAIREIKSIPRATKEDIGACYIREEWKDRYVDFLVNTVDHSLFGLKVVLDCANGAASSVAKQVFDTLGAETIVIHNAPNGININVDAGSTHPESLQQVVIAEKADIGLAFDGDADRLIAVDHQGNLVDGDGILYVLACVLQRNNQLQKNTVVSTVMSNFGFAKALEPNGIETVQTQVGDRYVLEQMLENGYNLGGEQSGHILFLDYNTTGDGILSAVQLVGALKHSNQTLYQWTNSFVKYPQKLVNVRVKDKKGWEVNTTIQKVIQASETSLSGNGRILVRASGTENLIRVMAEAEKQEIVEKLVAEISAVIQSEIS